MCSPPESDPSETGLYSEHRVDESPTETVVTAVAEATGLSPLEVEPLWKAVDPDALDALFGGSEERPSATVTFDYCGQRVTVTSDGVRIDVANA